MSYLRIGWRIEVDGPAGYSLFYVTKQLKSCVVCGGATIFKGTCLNHAALLGTDLSNRLTDVLARFLFSRFG